MNNDQNSAGNQQLNILNNLNNNQQNPVANNNPVPNVDNGQPQVANNNPVPTLAPTNPEPVQEVVDANDNRFINPDNVAADTSLDTASQNPTPSNLTPPEYTRDPQVIQNIQEQTKKTIPVTKELKTVIVIALILFLFIIAMPIIADLLNKVRFR